MASRHPLGPLAAVVRPVRLWFARLMAGATLCGASALLGIAARLDPSPEELGSHVQLGLASCALIAYVGYPCPTCGMTTAFAHMVHGRMLAAFRAQPAGLVLAIGTVAAACAAIGVLATGKVLRINWYRISPTIAVLGVVGLVLIGWAYKLAAGVLSGSLPVRA